MSFHKALEHPTFGPCELVQHIIAIRWKTRLAMHVIQDKLKNHALMLAHEVPEVGEPAREGVRDPRHVHVNQSQTLTWATSRKTTEDMLDKLREDEEVLWVAPVWRALRAQHGPQSYFAINPMVVLVTERCAASIDELSALGEASIDEARSRLLRGFVVVDLPRHNAIEVGQKLIRTVGPENVLFENFPYLSPTAGREDDEHGRRGKHDGCDEYCGRCCYCGGRERGGRDEGGERGGRGEGQRRRCAVAGVELIPNDPLFPAQWDMQRINAPRAWPISEGSPAVVIAVLDTGVELDHPDLDLFPLSYSTITHTNNGSPVAPHGTACAGIIGGRINNAIGMAGLAGRSRVMAISTNWSDVEVAEGLFWAADNGARVISMSFGVYASWSVWNFAIIQAGLQFAEARNLVLVAATGNENQPVSRFPASDPTTIGVGGSNKADVRKAVGDTSSEPFWGACFGPDVDVVAPCLEIPTTDELGPAGYTPTDFDLKFNGTSSATPHVAALAGLILSVNPALSNVHVRRILSETTDKINQPSYVFAPTPGKPFGTWNDQVGYGRINAERALLATCATIERERCEQTNACEVDLRLDPCCVSPGEPPWYCCPVCVACCETKCLCVPIKECECPGMIVKGTIEISIEYEHKLCLCGKQQGPLLFTQTLLPGEKVTLFHHERYRRVAGEAERFSAQTTFLQFLSAVHQANTAGSLELLGDRLATVRGSAAAAVGGGLAGLLGVSARGASTESRITDHRELRVGAVSAAFQRSAVQSAQLTGAERSILITGHEDKETASGIARTLSNDNDCRAVTYFVRQVMELWSVSTRVCEIKFRVCAPGFPLEWRSIEDIGSLPRPILDQLEHVLKHLPRPGECTRHSRCISLPTDGCVFDPELACCCSCEPERSAALAIQLEKQKAEARQACLEAQALELELERRRLLLERGELAPFGQ
jgi:Subtilase family